MTHDHTSGSDPGSFGVADHDPAASGPVDEADADVTVDELPDAVLAMRSDGTLVYANGVADELLGWDHETLAGRSVLDLIHPDDLNLVVASFETVGDKRSGELIEVRARTSSGDWMALEVHGFQRDHHGEPLTIVVARDISRRHTLDVDRGEATILRSIVSNMHAMAVLVDPDGRIRSVNAAVTRLLGYDPELIAGTDFADVIHPDDRNQVVEVVERIPAFSSESFDARLATASGDDHVTCEFSVKNMTADPVLGGWLITGQVATALADARNRVEFLAEHDSRTGLYNRDGFIRRAADLSRAGGGLGLLLLDVVAFRSINELYGERTGDHLLTAIADRLDEIRWPDLIVSRFGGDEFVLAVRAPSDTAVAMLEERVRRSVGEQVLVDGEEVRFAVRTAMAYQDRPEHLESLLATASSELMRIKRNAEPPSEGISIDALDRRRRQLDELRRALADGQIQPYFQPIVDIDGIVRAVEALVRWVHPVRGVLGVGDILPIAQMAGLAEHVDDQVLDRALAFAARLTAAGHGDVEVHVNVDPKVISQPAFAMRFLRRCDERGARPDQIVVELTETDLLAPGAASLANMQELRRAGTHVSIDDFGTGYSSLSHLLELPVDGVKIDKRFIAGIDVDPTATNLTTAIVGLSHSLHLGCVAEGVEQPYQRDRLHELGCGAFQGWLYSAAVPPEEILEMLPRIELAGEPAPSPTHA